MATSPSVARATVVQLGVLPGKGERAKARQCVVYICSSYSLSTRLLSCLCLLTGNSPDQSRFPSSVFVFYMCARLYVRIHPLLSIVRAYKCSLQPPKQWKHFNDYFVPFIRRQKREFLVFLYHSRFSHSFYCFCVQHYIYYKHSTPYLTTPVGSLCHCLINYCLSQ